jgi:hypothetical protein
MGAARVVFDYVFLSRRHVGRFADALPPGLHPQMFTLWTSLDVVAAREAKRADRERLGDRVRISHAEIASNLDALGCVIDAGTADAPALAGQIHEMALRGVGRVSN